MGDFFFWKTYPPFLNQQGESRAILPTRQDWARTFKCLWGPGIDSKEWIPPAYVAWRAGTKTLFLLSV